MPRKLTALLATLVLLSPAAALGCGDDDDGGGGGGTLSAEENLRLDQDRADIDEFCSLSTVGEGDLYDRAFFAVVAAVDDVIAIYKENPDGVYHESFKDREIPVRRVVEDAAKKLRGCGGDGRRQSEELTEALQSS